MVDGFTVDNSEIVNLAADLGAVPDVAGRFIRKAVEVSSRRIKDDWKEQATGFVHAPAFPYSIGYDIATVNAFGASVIQSEIGPDKERRQGALGNLMEFGSVNNPTMGLGAGALERAEDDFQHGLEQALADAEHVAGVDGSVSRSAGAVIRGSYF